MMERSQQWVDIIIVIFAAVVAAIFSSKFYDFDEWRNL